MKVWIWSLYLVFGCMVSAVAAERPNVVIIFADDLGYGDVGCFGAEDIATPAIDRLAEEGMRFTDFYSASPVCSPSRAGLLTGRYPVRMGINGVFFPQSFDGIDPEEVTLAEALKDVGYRTGIVGKWHLGHHYEHLPLQNGFDSYFGIPYSNDMEMVVYMRGNEVESYDVDQRFLTRRLTEEAVSFIESNKDDPFFLYLAHPMPHVPLHVSDRFAGSSQRGLYGDVVQELDWGVGEILDTLERNGLEENTLVIFTSDNGPWLAMRHLGGSAGPFREGKMFTFEGGMREPTVARWPRVIAEGSESTAMASMLDWFPTILGAAGAALPEGVPIDGYDLMPVLAGTGERASDRMFYFHTSGELRAFRDGKWKLKRPYAGNEGARWRQAVAAHPLLLIDLEADPGETENLADRYPERVEQMLAEMDSFLEEMGELPPSKHLTKPADESHYRILSER